MESKSSNYRIYFSELFKAIAKLFVLDYIYKFIAINLNTAADESKSIFESQDSYYIII